MRRFASILGVGAICIGMLGVVVPTAGANPGCAGNAVCVFQFNYGYGGGNAAFGCLHATWGVFYLTPVQYVDNYCGTRVWLERSSYPAFTYCISPYKPVTVPSWAAYPDSLGVSTNRNHC
jgi:hypothetical protein